MVATVVGVPFRLLCRGGNGNDPAVVLSGDATTLGEAFEGGAEALVADAQGGPELGPGEGLVGQGGEDVGFEIGGCMVGAGGLFDDFEVGFVDVLVGVQA